MIIALVPVKGKSKRLPGKNLRLVHGVPLFCYTLQSLRLSPLVDKIIVSTESSEVVEIAMKFDQVEIDDRPPALAADPMEVAHVLWHFIQHRLEVYAPLADVDGVLLAQPNLLVLPEVVNILCRRYMWYRRTAVLHEVVSVDPHSGVDNGALRMFDPNVYQKFPHSVYQMFLPIAPVSAEIHDEEDLAAFRDRLVTSGVWPMINELKDIVDG